VKISGLYDRPTHIVNCIYCSKLAVVVDLQVGYLTRCMIIGPFDAHFCNLP
jgi:hypothetical protein